ncbi:MAG: imidazolonepropionase [Candidatus Schekmanbacteria bacterium RBG_13_48_7]|uniref:Imidazolonepropionase n=1 Tax=Candidatus Schekmanbacteria bacterium RBG_13_48_7 TaxID=1817878 RepID=A0A1F7S7P7_9BACT|nr:MAG: imidazolonepropionase [Candidatus Schekmanbacteria bacterium RBG_13_48_7]
MKSQESFDLLITNASQLITLKGNKVPRRTKYMSELGIIKNGAIAVTADKIHWVGPTKQLPQLWLKNTENVIDASGSVVMPGFVDPHTHLVFGGSREKEFALRASGATYSEIAKSGGGILSTVRATRKASFNSLVESSIVKLDRMIELGTTAVEIKSGYALNLEDELKILKTIKELVSRHPISIVSTFLGAHICPPERDKKSYIDFLKTVMIPQVASQQLAEFCDVFCEDWVFTKDESFDILKTGLKYGLLPKIHTEQFHSTDGYKVAIELNAVSADHLDYLSDQGINDLASSNVIGCLLPGASFFLGSKKYPPARKMIDAGIAVALSTDFNPGSSMTQSMPLMMTIACTHMGMTPAETIVASTINAACAIKKETKIGSLEQGKQADFIIIDANDYRVLPYHFGVNLVKTVIKNGKIVFPKDISIR